MFYPKCPKCGGKSKSDEEDNRMGGMDDPRNSHALSKMSGGHPLVAAGSALFSAGRFVYKRTIGRKVCQECDHKFT